jgi:hypothetical protein
MAISVKVVGKQLIITADLETPTASKSGKSLVVVSTRGNMRCPDTKVDGKEIVLGLNAYIKA